MVPEPTRRTLLRSGSVLAATALAGCSAVPGWSDSNDPDAGTDSYGVLLTNEIDEAYTVTITARSRGDSETVFDETVEVGADDSREWNQVLTGEGLYNVRAVVDAEHFIAEDNTRTVSVGASNSYEAENVVVRLSEPFEDVAGVSATVGFNQRA
jgi:hypothetical protein